MARESFRYRTFKIEDTHAELNNVIVYKITKENGREFFDPDGTRREFDEVSAKDENDICNYIDRVYFGGWKF